jgi:hypothetical protein
VTAYSVDGFRLAGCSTSVKNCSRQPGDGQVTASHIISDRRSYVVSDQGQLTVLIVAQQRVCSVGAVATEELPYDGLRTEQTISGQ